MLLDHKQCLCPIGVGDILRDIGCMMITKKDVTYADGAIHVCTDREPGPDTAIDAMQNAFDSDDVDATLLTDIAHVFNSINLKVILNKTWAAFLIILTTYFTTTKHLKGCLSLEGKISDHKKKQIKGFQN